ncbi:transcriptional regulator BetI [Pseudomonas xionganensis]|uniref:HTH-type transcriptional regulator BetI n=1 Tax=Pseudomonas xionganensis TaxID=2654845 RepID=A0A6I4KS06_9PSED|nr:transcriptional regulator BetI [Pseudomonas xionganensis]MVW74518.1 transcriptional regulator BetI [Pseudomonas xionganensis]
MPKIGIKQTRRQQLIQATLESIAELGLQDTTILTISRKAQLSSGIISHYFGGKQALIEAALRYLLEQLRLELLQRLQQGAISPEQRLLAIVEANFTEFQRSELAARTWLSFWARSMHEPGLARLQRINNRRLYSNLRFAFAQRLPAAVASDAAAQAAALIDGFWLRSALDADPQASFSRAERLCKAFVLQCLAAETHNFSEERP